MPENPGCASGTCQEVSMTYDGHGRMKTRHYPIEDAGANMVWEYNADDANQQIVDSRCNHELEKKGSEESARKADKRGLFLNFYEILI